MLVEFAAVLWEFRPRRRRAARLSLAPRLPRPVEVLCGHPGEDPLLVPLARLGGDWPAHAVVHGAPLHALTHDEPGET